MRRNPLRPPTREERAPDSFDDFPGPVVNKQNMIQRKRQEDVQSLMNSSKGFWCDQN